MLLKKIFGIRPSKRTDVPNGLRGDGYDGGDGIFNEYLNQLFFETQADHIIDIETNVKLADDPRGTCYWNNSSSEFQDEDDATVTFSDGDRIVWRGLDTPTTNIDISTIDDLEHIMAQGVTIDLDAYDLDLGENQRGELDLEGSGTLTILSSDGLRIKTDGVLSVVVSSGDSVINNQVPTFDINTDTKNLLISNITNATVDVSADSIKLVNSSNQSITISGINETLNITTDLNAGSEKGTTNYKIWFGANIAGSVEKKLVPDLAGTATSTSAGKLVDSGATFQTDFVQTGDVIYNRSTGERTTVSAIDNETTLSVNDDIFTSSDDYIIILLSPQFSSGFDFIGYVGTIFNNGSLNFESIEYESAIKYAYVRDEKTSGTGGGSPVAGYQTRVLNTIETNINEISLSSNQITLGPGHYKIIASAPIVSVGGNARIRFRNITDSTTDILGTSTLSNTGLASISSFLYGAIVIDTPKTFEVQHYATSASGSLGSPVSTGENEIYTVVEIFKEA